MDLAVITAVTLIIASYLIPNILKMLCKADNRVCISSNYRGKAIPAIGGIVFVPVQLSAILQLLLQRPEHSYSYLSYIVLLLSMGFAGVIDDLVGDRGTKGLISHMKNTLKGNMTTGFFKAFTGFLAACIISLRTVNSYVELIINILIISLYANTVNLFDLRPGRAIKVFLSMSLILFIAAAGRFAEALPLIILNLAVLIFIGYDLREVCMLGDTGANILGITLGYYSSLFLNFNSRLMLLVLLVFLNLISERISITELIDNNKVLSYLDSLGRGQARNE
jgi:hypothetical protein